MNRNKEIIRVSVLGIIVNLLLVIFKAFVGFLSNSIAIILDAVNNLSDALSSIITIIGTKLSSKKPDKEHPYGHGRIEYFSAMIIAIIVLLAGLSSLKESIEKIIEPVRANYRIASIIVVVLAIFVKYFFGTYVKKEGERLKSGSLIASGVDALGDSVISISTLIAALVSIFLKLNIEGYIGVIISFFIIKSAMDILKSNANDMIGIRADSKLTNSLKRKIISYKDVLGVHDLTLHNYGPNSIIATAHIDVKDDTKAKEIHRITRRIAIDIYNEYGIILTLGIYATNDDKKYADIKKYLNDIEKKYKTLLEIHGFYVDDELSKIFFDVIFDFKEKNIETIVEEIRTKLKEKFPKYDYSIIVDNDISD